MKETSDLTSYTSEKPKAKRFSVTVNNELQMISLSYLFMENEILTQIDGNQLHIFPQDDLIPRMRQLCALNNLEIK